MKAAVLKAIGGGFEIEEVQIGEPRGNEVLVEVKAAGLCHSDLHLAESNYGIALPAVLGHELAGVVRSVGPDVKDFTVGDHVVGSLVQYCGHCMHCVGGSTWICEHPEETLRPTGQPARLLQRGHAVSQVFGLAAFAELALVHAHQLARVPVDVPFTVASLLGCGAITGIGAVVNSARVRPGETVAVIGIGGVGLNVISGAHLAGAARIVAIDTQPMKQSLARQFGATDFIDASQANAVEALQALIPGGVDHTFEVVGLPSTLKQAIKMTCKGGGMYVIGLPKPGTTLDVEVHADLIRRQITIKGVYMGSTNIKRDIPMYADMYRQGRIRLDELISREINLHEINTAYDELRAGKIARSVVTSF
jgi:S-(hydroxymethyl)glutathione dehydrogenase/alcohol dehydrogenase